jgi:hypothetical protein
MRSALVFLACVIGCAGSQPEAPATNEEPVTRSASVKTCERNRIQLLLSAPHDPPTRAELSAVCDNPVPVLVSFAIDTSLRGLVRLRSIEALGRFGGADAKRTLEERATASGDLASVRRASLAALREATVDDAAARERVGLQAMTDPDGHVRVAAVRLLSGIRRQGVRAALEAARTKETEVFVRNEIERELARH